MPATSVRSPEADRASRRINPSPERASDPQRAAAVPLSAVTAATVVGCGGGDETVSPSQSGPTRQRAESKTKSFINADEVDQSSAARFLGQAAFGASPAEIAKVQRLGYAGWIEEQFELPVGQSLCDWLIDHGQANLDTRGATYANGVWQRLMTSPDALRQRVWLALSEILVISVPLLNSTWRGFMGAKYMDILEQNCFGTYRKLLEAVTLSAPMGLFLSMRGSRGEDGTGRAPDENFAREIMQLFTIGLYQLDRNGTYILNSEGKPIETYSQLDITELAKVFTGWDFDGATDRDFIQRPMKHNAAYFSRGAKTFLGVTIPASATGPEALKTALDTLANHENVGPFICRQLIQRMVTSNPSKSFIGRVSKIWSNNGKDVRGDLKSVIRAILLDPEARAPSNSPLIGKLREPIQRLAQWGRTFNVGTGGKDWSVRDTADPATRLGQAPFQSPSVFNFFRPGYVPPASELAQNNIPAPEFQITNETSVAGYINFMNGTISDGFGNAKADYAREIAMAKDANGLVDEIAMRLGGGAISSETKVKIVNAISSISTNSSAGLLSRVQATILLIMACPEYLIQK